MPKKAPTRADFPSHLSLTITPPPSQPQPPQPTQPPPQPQPPPNILLLLHGLGDSATAFTSFARALHLPETTILTIQAPHPLPFDLPGAHWGDDVTVDSGSAGGLDMDGGFERATRLLVDDVVRGVLVRKCGYGARDILVFGFGQGGMAALCVASALASASTSTSTSGAGGAGGDGGTAGAGAGAGAGGESLSGVVSIGAPYPLSSSVKGRMRTSRTPVLLVAGRDSTAVSDGAVQRTKQAFDFVEVHRYARRGDGMPRNRDEMWPVMQFLARRLRSWRGVPEGSVEVT